MIVEERTYTLHPGKAADWLRIYEADAMATQVPVLGHMVGYFTTEFGPLNQVIHMWGYDGLDDRARRRAELFAKPAWNSFLGKVRPFLIDQDSKVLLPAPFSPVGGVRPAKNPKPAGKIVEERVYTLIPGKSADYVKAYEAEGMAVQIPVLGHLVGYFTTEHGPMNQITHIWSYDSLEDRSHRRAELFKIDAWNAYLGKVRPFILRQENKLLVPAPFSPVGGVRPVKNP